MWGKVQGPEIHLGHPLLWTGLGQSSNWAEKLHKYVNNNNINVKICVHMFVWNLNFNFRSVEEEQCKKILY